MSDIERCFRNMAQTEPFSGAVFSWWSIPSNLREPDVVFSAGAIEAAAFSPSDPWLVSAPVITLRGADEKSADMQVAVIGPGRRLAVLQAALAARSADMSFTGNDWRGRFLLLAHLLSQAVGALLPDTRPNLGRREIQCLKLAAEGLKAKQIASTLGIGQQTVQFHLSRAREKLDCSNTVQAVARAAQYGLLPDLFPKPSKRS